MKNNNELEKEVEGLINEADIIIGNTIKNINYELINMYWNLGKIIVQYKIKNNSKYGDAVVVRFRERLFEKYGAKFGEKNIKSGINLFKQFKKSSPANFFKNVSWSLYQEIINSRDKSVIKFYLNEANTRNLTKLELRCKCQIQSL